MAEERLQKLIAQAGIMSRRHAEQAITEGRVKINGNVVTALGTKADLTKDEVEVDGVRVQPTLNLVTLAFNKPRKAVTTKYDPEGRPTIMDWIPKEYAVNPVGRLDFESEGLILLTNDGALANQIMHPRFGIPKTYWVKTKGLPTKEDLAQLLTGIPLTDGPGKFESVKMPIADKDSASLEIVVREGRNRFIRRMLDAINCPVARLRRTQIGPIRLGNLASGKFRILSKEEIEALKSAGAT